MSPTSAPAPRRIEIFDGLRGIAIILVVLSRGWTISPDDPVLASDPLDTLFRGQLRGLDLLRRRRLRRHPGPHPARPVPDRPPPGGRRRAAYIPLTGQVALFLLVAVLVTVFNDTNPREASPPARR